MISLPNLRQKGDADCGTTARSIALLALGIDPHPVVDLSTAQDGTHPATMESLLRKAGARVQSGNMTVDDLKHHTRLGRPVLCPVDRFGGHWVVVSEVWRTWITYQCPADGSRTLNVRKWLAEWKDSTRAGHDFDRWGIAVINPPVE